MLYVRKMLKDKSDSETLKVPFKYLYVKVSHLS